ncbi:C2H2 zinc finger [Ceratobasidium sp. AG-Ba]|nr:C2H2 zinc finger [Ceratobasidium sp. AG-Ba]
MVSKATAAHKLILGNLVPNRLKAFVKPASASSGREPKPPIKVEIPHSEKRRLADCKLSNRLGLHVPTPKGVDDHWGTHRGCPTIFEVYDKFYLLYEDGTIFMRDDQGFDHSAAEMPATAGGSCRILGESFTLSLDKQGYLCVTEDDTGVTRRLQTWCFDNDPLCNSPQLIPGRGCFCFRVGGCATGSPLENAMFGIGHTGSIPTETIQAWNVTATSPVSASSSTSNNSLPYPLVPSPTSTGSEVPTSPLASPEYTIPHGQTSIERRTCPRCNKVLRRPSALRIHLMSHLGIKPCKCPEPNCDYASTNDTNLHRHIQTMHRRN